MGEPDPELMFRQEAVEHHARRQDRGGLLHVRPRHGRRVIPLIQQMTIAECGAATLAMTLAYHGKEVGLGQVREVIGMGRDGASAFELIQAGEHFGLRGRGVKIELEELGSVPRGSILHWGFAHFVVLDRVRDDSADILDPMVGRRRVGIDELRTSFTGVALLFEPADDFVAERRASAGVWEYARVLLRASRGTLVRIIGVSLLLQVFALAVPVTTGLLVDRVLPDGDPTLRVLAAGLAALTVCYLLSVLVRARLLIELRARLDHKMTLGFVDHLIALPYTFFLTRPTGDLMQRWSSNAQIREILTAGTLSAALDGALVTIYLVLVLFASWTLGILAFVLGAGQFAIYALARRKKRELLAREIAEDVRAQSYQLELLSGMETLKSLGAERIVADRWGTLYVNVMNASIARGRFDALVDMVVTTLRFAAPVIILLVGASQVLDHEMTLGKMLALSALTAGFQAPLAALVTTMGQLQLLGHYLERLDDVFRATPEHIAGQTPAPTLTGQVELTDVAFRYSPNTPLVLDDVSVTIAPGQLVGIVGKSGAGKSTLAALLAGLYMPTSGTIRFDGRDLTKLDLRSLRSQLGMVTQNPYVFATTIAANISLARPSATLDEITAVAKRAHIHDDIAAMPMGYDTPLSDRGASLSGGQRQRIALARALLAKPAVLVLDEATSALDSITEQSIQASLAEQNCTRVVIAHRLATVVGADLILVMDGGKIVARGTHAELLAAGGLYAQLAAGLS